MLIRWVLGEIRGWRAAFHVLEDDIRASQRLLDRLNDDIEAAENRLNRLQGRLGGRPKEPASPTTAPAEVPADINEAIKEGRWNGIPRNPR